MRTIASTVGIVCALLLTAASIAMNCSFWAGQGSDPWTARVLGCVSIGIDGFKPVLPFVMSAAWRTSNRSAFAVTGIFFAGCLAFSFLSAIGFASTSRGATVGERQAVSLRLQTVEHELTELEALRSSLPVARPRAVVEEVMTKTRQDHRWSSSNECQNATLMESKRYCAEVGNLRIELATATELEQLRREQARLKTERDRLLTAGANRELDPQVALLARLSGWAFEPVQTSLSLLIAALVEMGAAFGFFLALLPLKDGAHRADHAPRKSHLASTFPPQPRLARTREGRLMIE